MIEIKVPLKWPRMWGSEEMFLRPLILLFPDQSYLGFRVISDSEGLWDNGSQYATILDAIMRSAVLSCILLLCG